MLRLKILLQCLARALCEQGARSLNGIVPFGEVIYQVAMATVQHLRDARQDAEVRASLEWAASARRDDINSEVAAVVAEAEKYHPPLLCKALSNYLTHFPSLLRQALKRPADLTGTTVPPSLVLETPEDLLPYLPSRIPRFKAGERLRGPLSDWKLISLLGLNSFGETWKARHTKDPDKPLAALRLCTDFNAPNMLSDQALKLQEIRTSGQLPAVSPLIECFFDLDPPVCRYDYHDGCDLTGLIRDGQPAPTPRRTQQATLLMKRAAAVVGALHRLDPPIIHRGLKPRNFLLQQSGPGRFTIQLLDLGIAELSANRLNTADKLGQVPQPEILAASLRGTFNPLYASPQQMRGEPPEISDDIHALGVIWYQMIVGDLVDTPTGRDWLANLKKGGVGDAHTRLLSACINPRPERRPADAMVLADELGALLVGSGT